MTAVIFSKKHKQVAFESRLSIGTRIATDNDNKSIVRDGVAFVFAGAASDCETLIAMYFDPSLIIKKLDCQAIVVDDGVAYITENTENGLSAIKLDWNEGIGSGSLWALAALDWGCTPKEAIKYAIKKDSACGGRIRLINL